MKFTKKELLDLLKEAPMDFDTPDRPHTDVTTKLAQGDTPLKKVPLPKTGDEPNKNFQELLASERYRQVVAKLKEYTGIETPMVGESPFKDMQLTSLIINAHNEIIRTEMAHKEELEKLAIDLVKKEMGIEEGEIQFDAKIVGVGEIDVNDFNRDAGDQQNPEESNLEMEEDLMSDLEKLNLEKAKRRLINSMIQGASKKGHYMYHYVADKIEEITGSETLLNQYGVLMSSNDIMYWQFGDKMFNTAMSIGASGGKEQVKRNTNPPTVVARGVNFPVLVHELIKGVMELLSIDGRPKDDEGNESEQWGEIERSEDTFEKEVWDIRLGPAIWSRIRNMFPEEILIDENKTHLQNYLLMQIFKLPAKQFLVLMKEVISNSDRGKTLMDQMMESVYKLFNDESYDDEMEEFNDTLDSYTDETDDDDLGDFLSGLGITLSNDDDDE